MAPWRIGDSPHLKIDRSFVLGLGRDRLAGRLVRGIVALANVLRVTLVAEGVETEAQAQFLRAIGVEKGQGWLWSHDLDAAGLVSAVGPRRSIEGSTAVAHFR